MTLEPVAVVNATVATLIKTLWARGQVTPVAAPRDNQGRRLVAQGG
jgi:hypothetical protein